MMPLYMIVLISQGEAGDKGFRGEKGFRGIIGIKVQQVYICTAIFSVEYQHMYILLREIIISCTALYKIIYV